MASPNFHLNYSAGYRGSYKPFCYVRRKLFHKRNLLFFVPICTGLWPESKSGTGSLKGIRRQSQQLGHRLIPQLCKCAACYTWVKNTSTLGRPCSMQASGDIRPMGMKCNKSRVIIKQDLELDWAQTVGTGAVVRQGSVCECRVVRQV